jgi:nitrogen fixation/metabolism regulation signal transduction histidine kinase
MLPLPALADVPRVITDIPPVYGLVAQVMGDLGAPVLLLEKGADEHDFQLRPSQMRDIASADVAVMKGDQRMMLHVQITAERFGETIEGYIVTFDDITALVAAQRSAAWADVAQRIAHEIKNPLTPITLSAERLRKKFGPEITSDREAYDRYLDTIARHVRDIGRMVEEFVSFARLPAVQLKLEEM